ncbi:hypothetical protein VitviT2T_014840 [Vitis vinifera]|uniref:Uncharacterized protein n=1 Tax=Vitis vinifera TaxID=29760 RepID=A0ABY9CLR2_VITVI|nr:hypothetical protein VitviT2T_014840 [Vitis vinifera]
MEDDEVGGNGELTSETHKESHLPAAFSGVYTSAQVRDIFEIELDQDNSSDRDGASTILEETESISVGEVMKSPFFSENESSDNSFWIDLGHNPMGFDYASQASLLSFLPADLLKISEIPRLTANAFTLLIRWFHDNFRVRSPSSAERPLHSSLAFAPEAHEGTSEKVAALSVALFRALNLTTRFVSILDVAPLKLGTHKSKSAIQNANRAKGSKRKGDLKFEMQHDQWHPQSPGRPTYQKDLSSVPSHEVKLPVLWGISSCFQFSQNYPVQQFTSSKNRSTEL